MSNSKNYELRITNYELEGCDVTFVPEGEFEPHVQEVVRTFWREVSSWFTDFSEVVLDVCLVSDEEIRRLNKLHRRVDGVTDVISLDYGIDVAGGKFGVIYLARDVLERAAKSLGHSFEAELVFLILHGILHVWGYDHEKKGDEVEMLKAAGIVLENFPDYIPLLATYRQRSLIDY